MWLYNKHSLQFCRLELQQIMVLTELQVLIEHLLAVPSQGRQGALAPSSPSLDTRSIMGTLPL